MHGSKYTVEFSRNRVQLNVSSGSRDTTRPILSSVRPARFNACQASNIWESSHSVDTNTVQFAQLFIESHEPHGDWFAFRSCQRVVSEKGVKKLIFAGRKLFEPREMSATHS